MLYAIAGFLEPFDAEMERRLDMILLGSDRTCSSLPAPITTTCALCDRRCTIGFRVAREVWRAVLGDGCDNRSVCPECFDAEAEAAHVRYEFSELWSIPWQDLTTVDDGVTR